MFGSITPDVASGVLALRRSHPAAPARAILGLSLGQRTVAVADFGTAIEAGQPFALLVAEPSDRGMTPDEWAAWTTPSADTLLLAAAHQVWPSEVLPHFTEAFGLKL